MFKLSNSIRSLQNSLWCTYSLNVALLKKNKSSKHSHTNQSNLFPFLGAERPDDILGIAYSVVDYFQLINWTGRAIRDDKKGAIPKHIQPLLQKLNINENEWLHGVKDFGQRFGCAVREQRALKKLSARLEKTGYKECGRVSNFIVPLKSDSNIDTVLISLLSEFNFPRGVNLVFPSLE